MSGPSIVVFKDATEKANWLDAAASEDALSPHVQKFARELAGIGRETQSYADVVRTTAHFARDDIRYEIDANGREEFADTVTILKRRYDDCDGKARVFVALIRALFLPAIQARIRPIFDSDRAFVHVQAEVRYPGSWDHKNAEQDGWLVVELILEGVDVGEDPRDTAQTDAAGNLIYSGRGHR